jgi:hyaluronan synthase
MAEFLNTVTTSLREFWPVAAFYLPIGAIGIWRWGTWLAKKVIALGYQPMKSSFKTDVSIVTPVYNENPAVFLAALESWHRNKPAQIIAVIDASDAACLRVFKTFAQQSRQCKLIVTEKSGKRPALAVGILAATSDIVALVDSDTIWEDTTLAAAVLPFRDPKVGGVSTRQSVLCPKTLAQKLFDIQLDLRYEEELPFLGAMGDALTCLSGRTAIYRLAALLPILDDMVSETFWSKKVISGEDKCLTYLVLAQGWKLKYQKTARVYTHGTETVRNFLKQRLRWTRNSWRADLRALTKPWLWRHAALAYFLLDRTIQPLVILLGPAYFIAALALGKWTHALVLLAWWFVTRAIRLIPHLKRRPQDITALPAYIFFTYATAIIRLYALFTLNTQGWITRWDSSRLIRSSLFRKLPAYAATGATLGVIIAGSVSYQRSLPGYAKAAYYPTIEAATVHHGVRMLTGMLKPPKTKSTEALLDRELREVVRASYRVKRGDTFMHIARRYNVDVNDLIATNKTRTGGRLIAGTTIIVPLNAEPATVEPRSRFARAPVVSYTPTTRTVLVLGPGADVSLADIARVVGERHLKHLGNGEWYLASNLNIGRDVHLRLSTDEVRWLKLASNDTNIAWLSTEGGRIIIDGVKITSWDATRNNVDRNIENGRSYILARTNGRLDILNADISYLGYALENADRGGIYGVSWRIAKGKLGQQLVTGEVRNSKFHHNYFGAYTFGATGMIWQGNEFFDNDVYGLDPHDDSNHFIVEGNRAYRNGKHGIIFSKRCFANVIRNNEVFENGYHGIMLHELSNDNLIAGNVVTNNRDGIAIFGSSGNVVTGNTVRGNSQGIRLSAGSTENSIEDNTIFDNRTHGVRLYADANANRIVGNRIARATYGVTVETADNELRDNRTRQTHHGLMLTRTASGNTIAHNAFLKNRKSGILIQTDAGDENLFGENTIDRGERSVAIR